MLIKLQKRTRLGQFLDNILKTFGPTILLVQLQQFLIATIWSHLVHKCLPTQPKSPNNPQKAKMLGPQIEHFLKNIFGHLKKSKHLVTLHARELPKVTQLFMGINFSCSPFPFNDRLMKLTNVTNSVLSPPTFVILSSKSKIGADKKIVLNETSVCLTSSFYFGFTSR